ncbi:TolC family protein [Flavobacterium marginilacus]|uniref:TolC family protein n=1 Tax=Flavobacterium marginilacus TaxID=3003256 RepID=UPI00248F002F|nr:TolC family protein [Flavobacterium marginilacus]
MKKINLIVIILCMSIGVNAQKHLTLEQVRSLALQNNTKVKNSLIDIDAATETKKEAYTNYFPKVSASAIAMQALDPLLEMNMKGGNLPVYDGNPANLAGATQFAYMPDVNIGLFNQMGLGYLNIVQPVYAGGKIKTGNQLAQLNIEVKEKQHKLSENEILLKTEQEYWLAIAIGEKQKTLDSYITFLDILYKQVGNAYKNGVIIKNDLLKVSIKQQELQVNKIKLNNAKKLMLMQLCQTIGMDYKPEIVLDDKFDDLSLPKTYFVSNQEVLPSRMEYQLLEKMVTGTKLETQMKKADYMPNLGIGVTGYYLDQLSGAQNGSLNGMAYASLSVPISDWWGRKHKLKELKFKEEMAKNIFSDNKGLLNLQMEKAWTDLSEADDKIRLITETLVQTTENLRVNQDGYNNGLIQLSDLLEAIALKAETEDKLIEAKNQYRIAITNYLQVTAR